MDVTKIAMILNKVREVNPLVHNITNIVVANFSANGLLALGASPFMADAKEEVADIARMAGSIVLNMGTINANMVEVMLMAGKAANEANTPVIFDPVGAGATPYRTETARLLAKELDLAVIRGNAAEIANVIGEKWEIKGVDAGEGDLNIVELAEKAAKQLHTTVAITGKLDVVSNGTETYTIENGHPILTKVTGTGCLLTAVVGAFAAVEQDYVAAAIAALTSYEVAAELALAKSGEVPGSFQIEFLNQLALVEPADVIKYGNIK